MKSDKDNKIGNLLPYVLILIVTILFAVVFKYEIGILNEENESINSKITVLSSKNQQLSNDSVRQQHIIDYLVENANIQDYLQTKMNGISIIKPINNFNPTVDTSNELTAQNIRQMNNIQNYGSDFTVEYISYSKNKAKSYVILSQIKDLADEICEGSQSETEKAAKIAVWISENIYYDHDAAASDVNLEVISLENVMSVHRTTCAGYSNLFSAMCNSQGIYCVNLRGRADVGLSEDPEWKTLAADHEWNAAYCDGAWHFYDTTWCSSNTYQNGVEIPCDVIDTKYIDLDFDTMSKERRIDRADFRDFYTALFEYDK